jgi:cell division septum initiation protein DivIVA
MDERRIVSATRQASTEVARANFTTVRKGGLDPQEVRLHLESVAREMGHLESRLRETQDQLSEALRRAANPTFDEATLTNALGTQSAAILRSAHEEAGRVTAEAQERSAQLFSESQQRAASHLIEAQERATAIITEAETTAVQIDHDARLAAERLIDSAKVNGEALVDNAREQGRAILEQSNEARKAVLNDLAVKRKALHMQIDQLRAARDSLATYVSSLSDQVEEVLAGINNSDEVARAAALEALRMRPATPEPTEEELLAGTPLREVPETTLEPTPDTSEAIKPKARKATKPVAIAEPLLLEDDSSGTDVVNEIFARLRKATLEERGADQAGHPGR